MSVETMSARGLGEERARVSPVASVLMPVHNGDPFLNPAIQSVLDQSFRDFELVIVDDGSTDGSEQTIKRFGDPRIIYVKNDRCRGISYSLNRGLEVVSTPLVARMDANDIALPDRLERQVQVMLENDSTIICGCQVIKIDSEGRPFGHIRYEEPDVSIRFELLTRTPFVHAGVIYRRDAVLKCGGYDESIGCAQDYDLWCRMAGHGSFANIPDVLMHVRYHGTGISTTRQEEQLAIHCDRSLQLLLESGIAKSADEALLFQSLSGLGERGVEMPQRNRWNRYVEMVEQFFQTHRGSSPCALDGEQACRRRLRQRFLRRAFKAGFLSREGRHYVWLARQIDPNQMGALKLGTRVFQYGIRKLWGRRADLAERP